MERRENASFEILFLSDYFFFLYFHLIFYCIFRYLLSYFNYFRDLCLYSDAFNNFLFSLIALRGLFCIFKRPKGPFLYFYSLSIAAFSLIFIDTFHCSIKI